MSVGMNNPLARGVASGRSVASNTNLARPSLYVQKCRAMASRHPELEASYLRKAETGFQVGAPSNAAPARAFPPIVSSSSRSADDVAADVQAQLQQFPQALVNNVEPDMYAALRKHVNGAQYHARAKMLIVKPQDSPLPKRQRLPGTVCVVSAGPEDQAAADQVKVAAEHLGCYVISKQNLSTRDMPKLMEQMAALQAADVVVVIAGVDSCLAGVVCGMVDAPVIAVPTSNGASNGLAGLGNLVAAVSSCAPGVSVVNIDGSINAAAMAARMLRTTAVRVEKMVAAAAAVPAPVSAQAPAVPPAFVLAHEANTSNGNGNGYQKSVGMANNVVPRFDPSALPTAQPAAVH